MFLRWIDKSYGPFCLKLTTRIGPRRRRDQSRDRRDNNMADVHQPHDRLFRAVFSDASEAVGLLQNALPDPLRHRFDAGWAYSTEFADLFPEAVRAWPWVPRFAHVLLDQTVLGPDAVGGGVRGRIARLLLMAAFGQEAPEALRLAAGLASSLEGRGADLDLFLSYLTRTQEREGVDTFKDAMQDHGIDIGGKLMTYAQELLAEGEAKGRAEGEARKQVEMVEGFLRVGVTWAVIEAATGLAEADFQALKAQLSGADS